MKGELAPHIILEAFEGSTAAPADDPWCVPNVKIIGFSSKNKSIDVGGVRHKTSGRRYTEQCLQEAASLYEGKTVYKDHAKPGVQSRDPDEVLGYIKGVKYVPGDGLRGNLHFTKRGELAQSVKVASQENPRQYGLSHNIPEGGSVGQIDASGVLVVHKIRLVESVDLVSKPGATGGLLEGAEPVANTPFTEFAKSLATLPAEQKRVGTLLESMGSLAEIEITPLADDATPEDQVKHAFKQVFAKITESYDGDDAAFDEQMKTAKRARHVMLTGEEPKVVTPAIKEGLETKVLGDKGAVALLSKHKITITPALVESFSGQTLEQAEPLLESFKADKDKIAQLEARLKIIPDDQKTKSGIRTTTTALQESVDKDGNPIKPKFVPRFLTSVN